MILMAKEKKMAKKTTAKMDIEKEKLELIKLRIRNKYYDRDEVLLKVVQEIYEHDFRDKKE